MEMNLYYGSLKQTESQIEFGVSELKKQLEFLRIPCFCERLNFYSDDVSAPSICLEIADNLPDEGFEIKRRGELMVISGQKTFNIAPIFIFVVANILMKRIGHSLKRSVGSATARIYRNRFGLINTPIVMAYQGKRIISAFQLQLIFFAL